MPKSIEKKLLDLVTDDYQQIVDLCADNSYGLPLPNRSVKHAGILTRAIFRNATDKVEIYSGSLDEFFLQDIEDAISSALGENADLTVEIILAHTTKLNDAAKRLQAQANSRMQFFKPALGYSKIQHFTVSGDMYRLEEHHPEDQNFSRNPEVKAQANFNGSTGANFLHEKFSEAKGEPLD